MNTFYKYFANTSNVLNVIWYCNSHVYVIFCACSVFSSSVKSIRSKSQTNKEKTHFFKFILLLFHLMPPLTAPHNSIIIHPLHQWKKRWKQKQQLAYFYSERKNNCVVIVIMAISLAVFVSDRHLYKNWIQLVTEFGNFSPSNTNQFHVNSNLLCVVWCSAVCPFSLSLDMNMSAWLVLLWEKNTCFY